MGLKLKNIDDITKEADFFKYLTKYLEKFQKAVSKNQFNDAFEISEWISIGYFSFDSTKIAEQLFKSTYLDTMKTLLLSDMFKKIKYENDYFINLLVPLINYSDAYELFNDELAKKSYLEWLINDSIDSNYLNKFNVDLPNYNILLHLLKVIHNVTHTLENRVTHRTIEFQKLLSKIILKCGEDKEVLKLFATLILAYTIAGYELDEICKEELNISIDTVKYLINMTKNINKNDKRCQGFPMKSILNGLRYVCATPQLCEEFKKQDGLDMICEILRTSKCVMEIEPALEIILHVILECPKNKLPELTNKHKFTELIDMHKNNKNALIFRHCMNIGERINISSKSKEELEQNFKKDGYKFDIFISYCHRNKDVINKIRSELLDNKYKIWFDEDQMSSDMVTSMASGIENSHVVMVSVSSVYKASANCKSEALYAKDLGKKMIYVNLEAKYKPKGWLGFIKAGTLYFEMSNNKWKLSDMIRELQRMLTNAYEKNSSDDEEMLNVNTVVKMDVKQPKAITNTETEEKIENWSNDDILKWLTDNGLEDYKDKFKDVNAEIMVELKNTMMTDVQFFNNCLKEEYGMTLMNLVKFKAALKKLNI